MSMLSRVLKQSTKILPYFNDLRQSSLNYSNLNLVNRLNSVAFLDKDHILPNILHNNNVEKPSDWKKVREEVLKASRQITPVNIDAMTLHYCISNKHFDLAFSYMEFLKSENMKPNLATIGKYLKLFYVLFQEKLLTEEQESMIVPLYKDLQKSYKVLDSITNEHIILALSVTKQWKECLKVLNETRISVEPNNAAYSATISAAFRNNEHTTGWQLMEGMLERNRVPLNLTYLAYIESCGNVSSNEEKVKKLEDLFDFFGSYDIKCNEEVASAISKIFRSLKYKSTESTITNRGVCKSCNQQLHKLDLTEDEFSDLKQTFFERVIIGKNVFCKTTPEELQKFRKFVDNMENFDVVIDGLNVAYSSGTNHSPRVLASIVASVVNHFRKENKKMLILGRKHMLKWPNNYWRHITSNAEVFLTENLSHDDPYLLYCALHCGLNTIIVSKDLMRSHIFLLKNRHQKKLFTRWLAQSQLQLIRANENGKVLFNYPLPYMKSAQKNGNCWHIPYETKDENTKWICLQR